MQNTQVAVHPYLAFDKNCKEAMEFYKSVLGGELEIMGFDEAPMEVPEDRKDCVMHASLKFHGAMIMASDTMGQVPHVVGNNNSISLTPVSVEQGEAFFNGLSVGGQVLVPYAKSFWGSTFGMCIDKFGIQWMIDVETA